MTYTEACTWLVEYGICTSDELALVTDINGNSMQTVNDILYARTGYHSIEQYKECEQEA